MSKFILIATLLLSFNVIVAQSDLEALDKKYTPVSSGKDQLSDHVKNKVGELRQGISFEVMSVTRGQLSFEYQREVLGPSIIGLVSVGIPFSYDFTHRFYGSEFETLSAPMGQLSVVDFYEISNKVRATPWLQIGCRFILDEPGDLDGRGIELRFRFQRESFDLKNSSNGFYDFSQIDEDIRVGHQTIFISYRSQTRSSSSSRFIHGLTYGIGYRMVSVPVIKYFNNQDPNATSSYLTSYDGSRNSQSVFSVLLTYTVGLGW